MARPLRIERVGGWYHVTGRGNERRSIFKDDRDRLHFCELLAEVVHRFRIRLHAYVLMDNHYHLIAELTESNLSRAGQWLNVSYSVWFNLRHDRVGHLFQGRFKSIVVDPEPWGLSVSRYVHLNPVRVRGFGLSKGEQMQSRAGVSAAPSPQLVKERIWHLRSYRWSSYRAYVGLEKAPDWLECESILELGGGRKSERPGRYREYVEGMLREGLIPSPWAELKEQVVLGGEEFIKRLRSQIVGDAREQRGTLRLAVARPMLNEVIAAVEKVNGEKWERFRDRHGNRGRDLALYLGRRLCGLKLGELAAAAGMKDYAAASMAIRRYAARLGWSKADQSEHRKVCRLLNVEM